MAYGMSSQRAAQGRSAAMADTSGQGGGMGKIVLLLVVLGMGFGAFQGYLMMERSFWVPAVDRAIAEAMDSQQYATLEAEAVRTRIRNEIAKIKDAPRDAQVYVGVGTTEEVALPSGYMQGTSWQRHDNAYKVGSERVPGCSVQDAVPPELTLRSLATGSGTGAGLLDRAKGIMDNDPNAALGRQNDSKTPPAYLVVDVLATFRKGWMKSRRWFHRRCLFYGVRRPYRKQSHSATADKDTSL